MSSSFVHDSFSSSVDHPAYIPWQTLSSDISASLKHGSVRISRANTLEYAPIEEEAGAAPQTVGGGEERIPLLAESVRGRTRSGSVASLAVKRGSSWTVATFLLVNAALGAGLLNYPYAYDKAGGILEATVLQIVMAIFLSATMVVLAYCADINGDETYHDVLLSVVGRRAQQLSAFSIMLTCFGVCVTFLIIIGDQFDRFFLSVYGENFTELWYLERRFTITATALLAILPMCYFKRLDFLRYASSLGIFAMLYPVFLTIYEFYNTDHSSRPPINTGPRNTIDLLTVIPVICFAYQTHEIVIPVYACMRDRDIRQFLKVTAATMLFLMVNYFLTGTYGYLTFGPDVLPDIMQQYDARRWYVSLGIVALIIKMVTSYAPLLVCGRGAIEGLYAELMGQTTAQFIEGESRRRITITTVWFLITLLLAIFTPNIGMVIEILGCVAAMNIFVFPGFCLYYTNKNNGTKASGWVKKALTVLALAMILFGAFIFAVVFYEVVTTWIQKSLPLTPTPSP